MFSADTYLTTSSTIAPYNDPTIQGLIDATVANPNKKVVVLADLDSGNDTHILLIENGVVSNILGLPNANGVLDTAISEYDMTDGAQLGGFLKWALANHATATTKTTLSYVGHGTYLAPDTDWSILDQRSAQNSLFPLPYRVTSNYGWTDVHPQKSVITPYALQQMLEIGTDGGATPLDVLSTYWHK